MIKSLFQNKSTRWIESIKSQKFLIAFILLSAVLRIYQLNHQSFWFEELMTLHYGKADTIFDFFRKYYQSPDASPPLFSFFIYLLRSLGIQAEWAFRLPSALFGVSTVFMTYKLAQKLLGGKTGIWASAFTAVSGALIYYSQEARYNSMLVFFILTFIYLYVDFHNQKSNRFKDGLLFFNVIILVLLHYLGILIMAEILFLSFIIKWKEEGFSKKILAMILLIFMIFLPWLNIFMGQLSVWTINKTVNEHPGFIKYTMAMLDYAFFYKPYWEMRKVDERLLQPLIIFTSAFILITVLVFVKKNAELMQNAVRKLNFEISIVLLMFIGNVLLFFIHDSFAKNKYFYEKNLLFTLPFLYMSLAALLDRAFTEKENIFVVPVLVAIFAYRPFYVIDYYHRTFKTEFRQSAEAIGRGPVLPVLVMCGDPRWYEFYFSKFNIRQFIFVKNTEHFETLIKESKKALVTYTHCRPDPVLEVRMENSLERELIMPKSLTHVGIYNFENFN